MIRTKRTLFFLLVLAAVALTPLIAQAGTAEFTNNEFVSVDSTVVTRTVSVGISSLLPADAVLTDVNIAINFLKTDGSCAAPAAGFAYHTETAFWLVSPTGTMVQLVNLGTYSGGTPISPVTVLFDDSAGTMVGGDAPVSGTFRPVSPLGAFNGQIPHGTWTLYIQDSVGSDPLCFYSYTLYLTTAAGPGCDQFVPLTADSVVGTFVLDTDVYWAPDELAVGHRITAGKSYWVVGMDATRQYYKVFVQCTPVWVPVNTVGPNYDEVWLGRPLPTTVVD